MSFVDEITVLILTYNEEPNIGRTLDALSRYSDILVVDSGSTDATRSIVARYSNARCVIRPFDTHAQQWNYGLSACGIERHWVLALDADYVLPPELVDEIAGLSPSPRTGGYSAGFRYGVFGKHLRAGLYPPVVVLYRRAQAMYVQEGHTQRAVVSGDVHTLSSRIDHDDRKPFFRWISSQQKYARLEADYLLATPQVNLGRNDRIRLKAWPAPILVFLYTLFAKRCLLDGWHGWYYVLQRTLAEIMVALEIVDRRLRTSRPSPLLQSDIELREGRSPATSSHQAGRTRRS